MTNQDLPPGFVKLTPKERAKKVKRHFKHCDYNDVKRTFVWLRKMLNVKVDSDLKKLPYVPSIKDLQAFYDAVWEKRDNIHIIMMRVLMYTGARVGELVKIKIDDIDLKFCQIRINNGKGGKDRVVPFPSSFKELLAAHVSVCKKEKRIYLFESKWHQAYTTRGIAKIFEMYSKLANLERNISPHKMRHFLFTWLKKQNIDDALIQPYSGHASRKNLEVYSRLSIGDAQQKYNDVIDKFPVQ